MARMSDLSFANSGPAASSASVRTFCCLAQSSALSPVTSSSHRYGSATELVSFFCSAMAAGMARAMAAEASSARLADESLDRRAPVQKGTEQIERKHVTGFRPPIPLPRSDKRRVGKEG